jgi:hypothetical protein
MVKEFVIGADHPVVLGQWNVRGSCEKAGGVRNVYISLVGDVLKNSHLEVGAVGGRHEAEC